MSSSFFPTVFAGDGRPCMEQQNPLAPMHGTAESSSVLAHVLYCIDLYLADLKNKKFSRIKASDDRNQVEN